MNLYEICREIFLFLLLFTFSQASFSVVFFDKNKTDLKVKASKLYKQKLFQGYSPIEQFTDVSVDEADELSKDREGKRKKDIQIDRQAHRLCQLLDGQQGKKIETRSLVKVIYALINPEDTNMSDAQKQKSQRVTNEISEQSVLGVDCLNGIGRYYHIYSQSNSLSGHPNYTLTVNADGQQSNTLHFSFSRHSLSEDDEVYLGLLAYLAASDARLGLLSTYCIPTISLDDKFMVEFQDDDFANSNRVNKNKEFVQLLLEKCSAIKKGWDEFRQ